MDRRELLQSMVGGVLAGGLVPRLGSVAAAASPVGQQVSPRIGMTTACLRDRIPGKLQPGLQAVTPALPLVDAAQFIRDTFGVTRIEIWSRQMPDDSDAYCAEIRRGMARAGCTMTNLQLDGPYNLSSTDPAERAQSIDYARQWIRRSALCGSSRMRINIDGGKTDAPFNPAALAPTLRSLQDYASAQKIELLIENHVGHSKKIANVAELMKVTHDKRIGAVLDWGNSAATTLDERLADFRLLFPYLTFVSAKGLHFDAAGRHVEYPVETIVQATEASGFRGIYSVELYVNSDFPDPIIAGKSMIRSIEANLRS